MEMSFSDLTLEKNLFDARTRVKKNNLVELIKDKRLDYFRILSKTAEMFFLSQFRNAGRKCKGQKWTKEEKCFYLTLYKKGPRTYRFLNKIFILPSIRTVQRTLGDININAGIHHNIIKYMSKMTFETNPLRKYCNLVFDEMAIKPHLDMMAIKDEIKIIGLEQFENVNPYIADRALVFMLTGINYFWSQPIACFFPNRE
jgi:hypothetical protein